ncbi:4Fe-4S dicluster domain-containing protein [Vallitalea guaymasensis]|uniref:4Fe-4S dicluster domain-containing protein n=1 Tax=Vallitalea guaymasensis TaxID=1185412 RepID=UPI000DE4EE8A|nr:reductive dehalogenase domain-containing protein [Vallitalea guaymasensis]
MNFPSIEKYVQENDNLIKSTICSKSQINIPGLISEYGGGMSNAFKTRLPILNKMVGCIIQSKKSASSIVKNPRLGKTVIAPSDIKKLESYIKSIGINSVGYTKVNPDLIFKDKSILYENAIVITMEMKKASIKSAPSQKAIKEIFRTYYELGVAVNKISSFLRKMGYNAMAGPAIGGDVSYVPLAQDAGLGVIGKHGLLITDKEFGPSLRIAAVYTDIENLPFSQENPHMWVKDFCDKCNKCVRSCPAGAIYEKAVTVGNDKMPTRCIDYTKCAVPFANDYGCTVCVKSCSFFNGDYYKIKEKFLK